MSETDEQQRQALFAELLRRKVTDSSSAGATIPFVPVLSKTSDPQAVRLTPAQRKELLLSAYERYTQRNKFRVGDLVRWKEGLRNRQYPAQEDPAIVCAILDKPILDSTSDSGNYTFREPLDIQLGVIGSDGTLIMFYYDSARFEPFSK